MTVAPQTHQAPADVREDLVCALRLDLVGPDSERFASDAPLADERLPHQPFRWYLTGFLVPFEADLDQKTDDTGQEELGLGGDTEDNADEEAAPDQASARTAFFPSSIGLSVLVPPGVTELAATVTWGDYEPETVDPKEGEPPRSATERIWRRSPHRETVTVPLPKPDDKPRQVEVPRSGGLRLVAAVRDVQIEGEAGVPTGTRAVAVFLVNHRSAAADEEKDRAYAFQSGLSLNCAQGFVARPNPRRGSQSDWDERTGDVQFRDAFEYAVGHGVAAEWKAENGLCSHVATTWTPRAEVEVVEPADIPGVELQMESLAERGVTTLAAVLAPLTDSLGVWIRNQRDRLPITPERRAIAEEMLKRAEFARNRIAAGIASLADPQVLEAFQLANRGMAMAARQREAQARRIETSATTPPAWRPFQLAFILMNLPGLADPSSPDREVVDLLFFPTGGGKTEAYLGLAAITLVLRRLRLPGLAAAGVSVLMRYTLRLLTLDQLGRAATLICALELLRRSDVPKLGEWPFEIGLWVGRAATPNRMGKKGDSDENCARRKVNAYLSGSTSLTPIPLENCPWCGTKFTTNSFKLVPNSDNPIDLRVHCARRGCDFSGDSPLPIVTVDEPIYRRLPCFIIATVDKFASLPWTGQVGAFFGRVERYDKNGFYGPCDPAQGQRLPVDRLPPPDLIIQDELHLISGPLGTVAGLYEAAIDELATVRVNGKRIRPKIVASTATVRRAERQIRALFGRSAVEIFPPASPNRRDSFFARTAAAEDKYPRLYLGLAAPGRSLKVLMLRSALALLGAVQRAYAANGGDKLDPNPADPYMTLVGYFNALRELGGSRRIVEDEVNARLSRYSERKRVGEGEGLFADRQIRDEVVELTSREPTSKVADHKMRLALSFTRANEKERVDVALATNMISVGLDITRLGLMVVLGQPKSSAEYIQATSRVGRDWKRPGLVVTLLNVHKPRDRSHFERFAGYHASFYRAVEATSVTPFAPRAIDRSLAAVVVGLARQGHAPLTPPMGAGELPEQRAQLDFVLEAIMRRGETHDPDLSAAQAEELRSKLRGRIQDLLDSWSKIAMEKRQHGSRLEYQTEEGSAPPLLIQPLDPAIATRSQDERKFKAYRSMRDVEPEVQIWLKRLDGMAVSEVGE